MEAVSLTYPLALPGPLREVAFGRDHVQAVVTSPFTFSQQVHSWPGQRWNASCKTAPARGNSDDASRWMAFFASLNGVEGTFRLPVPRFAVRRTVADQLGTPETTGTQAAGRVVTSEGWTPNAQVAHAGGWLTIAGRLRKVLKDAYSDADGKATLMVWPNIVAVEPSVIEWLEPYGIFRLTESPDESYDVARFLSSITFGCVEVIE